MTGAWIAAAAAAAAGLAAAYAAAGAGGLIVLGTVVASAALLAARAAIARPAARRRTASAAVHPADFPAFQQVASDLGWARVSRRHYDRITRPMFSRLLGAVLEERHRLDLVRHPQQARELVGADLWPLVDPAAPPSDDSDTGGPDLVTLSRLVDRLEQL